MRVTDLKLVLLKADKRQGTSKDGKEYLFYVATFLDENAKVITLKLGTDIVNNSTDLNAVLSRKTGPVTIDMNLYPSGFKLAGVVTRLESSK